MGFFDGLDLLVKKRDVFVLDIQLLCGGFRLHRHGLVLHRHGVLLLFFLRHSCWSLTHGYWSTEEGFVERLTPGFGFLLYLTVERYVCLGGRPSEHKRIRRRRYAGRPLS